MMHIHTCTYTFSVQALLMIFICGMINYLQLSHSWLMLSCSPLFVDSIKVSSVSKDALYAVCWSDSDEWCRAVVLSVPDPQSNVLVRYPDYGNQEVIPVSSLHQLPSKFYSLPFQVLFIIHRYYTCI